MLEIWNGHPTVHNEGGGGSPGLEEIWDILLTEGKVLYGIAVDDAHVFQGEFASELANPGRGWVAVNANSLDALELMASLEEGRFYASTGVALSDIEITPDRIAIHISEVGDFRFSTVFSGPSGVILAETDENPATFDLGGRDVAYIRAKVTDSGGRVAWTQPVFVTRR